LNLKKNTDQQKLKDLGRVRKFRSYQDWQGSALRKNGSLGLTEEQRREEGEKKGKAGAFLFRRFVNGTQKKKKRRRIKKNDSGLLP